jgi:CRISPR-associated endonuclease/helicase Cas3
MKKEFIAHRRKSDDKPQTLISHLKRVSDLSGQFAEKIGLEEAGRIIGFLHDLGKASEAFDRYIQSATGKIDPDSDEYVDPKEQKGKIDHSTAGAQEIFRELSKKGPEGKIAAQILALCIASHHSGLIDCLMPSGEDNFNRRISKLGEKTHLEEALSNLDDAETIKLTKLLSSETLTKHLIEKMKELKESNDSKETLTFKCGLLVRFLFSCLIDADRLDTADFEIPGNKKLRNSGKHHSWDILLERLNVKIKEFDDKLEKNEVDDLRNEVSQRCFDFSTNPKGIYQLTVPTGGGKTFASLRFSLNHAAHHKMDRVFYIIPFTSIIDQNADQVRKILEDKDASGKYLDKVVLEHHSNLTPDEESKRHNLLSENWDAPIVFTTQVQFLETLFGSGTRCARRMHQLANSVIIFDEVQTIPVRCVHMFNVALRFLVNNCGASIILCTATQPLLDKIEPVQRALSISSDQKIIQNEKELFQRLKLVKAKYERKIGGWSDDDVADLVFKELQETSSVLIIVNTKKSARSLYDKLAENKTTCLYHLSTNMCPAHRLAVLKRIKEHLDEKQPVICVSTQLIEAGVDIDFGSVIRYLAGLDSIAQAAGRCNRNGKRAQKGKVWIVNPQAENLGMLKDIQIGIDNTERVLGEFKDNPEKFDQNILSLSAMEQYYKYYFYQRSEVMNYPVSSKSVVGMDCNLFDLLSTNPLSVEGYKMMKESCPPLPLKQSFQTAAKAFHAIETFTRGVVVYYGDEGRQIISDLCSDYEIEKQWKLQKKAQRYSVNVFSGVFERLANQGAIHEAQEGSGIFYLDAQYYGEQFGLSEELVNKMEVLIS